MSFGVLMGLVIMRMLDTAHNKYVNIQKFANL